MARILILANSKRPDGQCLAGIDLSSGEWVRPVHATGDGIPAIRCVIGRRFISVRDILELDLVRPRKIAELQRENQVIRSWRWHIVGRLGREAIRQYIDNTSPILHSIDDRVSPNMLHKMAPSDWKSLQLVEPSRLTFSRHYFTPNRWVANFTDRDGNTLSLKITDADITRRLEAGNAVSRKSLLTISLTKPWSPKPDEKPPLCYKLVAAVIE
jgi:Dual OB-containing domain